MDYNELYDKWVENPDMPHDLRSELISIKGDDPQIEDRFYKQLEFGTAGLRGILGAGTNRMNIFVVRTATQGLCDVIAKENAKEKGVVISYDSRKYSDLFAKEAAKVFAGNNIKAYLFDELKPVAELSYAIRELKCIAGVMVTASHNPYQYNGYKAYWEDGGQLPPSHANEVFNVIKNTDPFDGIKIMDYDIAIDKNLIEIIGKNIEDKFMDEVLKLSVNPTALRVVADEFNLVFTPFHGAGCKPVMKILELAGHKNVILVKEQAEPDPMFSTVKSPNPEDKEGFKIAIEKYAKTNNSDLIIGTDPDCDRVGVMVRNKDGEYIPLTGNQVGAMLCYYILKTNYDRGTIPENGVVIKSIVSTPLADKICADFDTQIINVLTGFKFIGEKIKEFEINNSHKFLLGFEESYGYLTGTHARDKDGVNAAMLIAEMAAYYKLKDMSLYDMINSLYEKYGYYEERVISVTLDGIDGMQRIKRILSDLRLNMPIINGLKTVKFTDFGTQKIKDLKTGEEVDIGLPQTDMICFELEDSSQIYIRPSGTEPKIKAYVMCNGQDKKNVSLLADALTNTVKEMLK